MTRSVQTRPNAGRFAAGAVALATVAGLAACSSSGSAAPNPHGTARTGATSTPTASHGGSGKAHCDQLTRAQVQPLLAAQIAKVTVTAAGIDGAGQQCVFTGPPGNSGGVDVLVLAGDFAAKAYDQDVANQSHAVAVPGIGDRASRDTEDGQVRALSGDRYCSVTMSSNDDFPGLGPLMEKAGGTNHIAEAAYAAEAAALGTLCNRIFGSGNTTPDLSPISSVAATAVSSSAPGLPTDFSIPTDGATN